MRDTERACTRLGSLDLRPARMSHKAENLALDQQVVGIAGSLLTIKHAVWGRAQPIPLGKVNRVALRVTRPPWYGSRARTRLGPIAVSRVPRHYFQLAAFA